MSGNGRKRKEPPSTNTSNRRDKQREVAERRAAHFARAEPAQKSSNDSSKINRYERGQISSTPTGTLRRSLPSALADSDEEGEGTAERGQESWPGPFSTALAIMAKRDAAKKAREEAIAAEAARQGETVLVDTTDFDEYDRAAYRLIWPPLHDENASKRQGNSHRLIIPTLATLCASIIAKNFGEVHDLGFLPMAEREAVAIELAKLRQCDTAAALKLAVEGSQCLVLPECSEIDEECLVRAIEQVAGASAGRQPDIEEMEDEVLEAECKVASKGNSKKVAKTENDKVRSKKVEDSDLSGKKNCSGKSAQKATTDKLGFTAPADVVPELAVLRLRNCGRGMTDRTAAVCINLAQGGGRAGHGLEQLQLVGCYRLNDTALCGLLTSCRESLISLDLSCNSRLSGEALSCVRGMLSLQELTLNNCTQLVDDDILKLIPDAHEVCDRGSSSRVNPMSCPPLTALSLGGLIEITDDGVVPLLERYGPGLHAIDLSGCVKLTDRTLHCLRQRCSNLRSIALGQLGEVTTAALLGLFVVHPTAMHVTTQQSTPLVSCQKSGEIKGTFRSEREDLVPARIGYLEEVRLVGTVSVTDDVIVQMCESNKRTIRVLDVNGCYQLTSRTAMALLKHCSSSLQTMDVSFVRGISQEALGTMIDAGVEMDSLRSVTVWGCTQLTDKFWSGIRKDGVVEVIGRMSA